MVANKTKNSRVDVVASSTRECIMGCYEVLRTGIHARYTYSIGKVRKAISKTLENCILSKFPLLDNQMPTC